MKYDVMTHKHQQLLNTFLNPLLGDERTPTGKIPVSPDAPPLKCAGRFYNQNQKRMLAAYKAMPRGVCDGVMSELLNVDEDEVKVLRSDLIKNNHIQEVGLVVNRSTGLKEKSWGVLA